MSTWYIPLIARWSVECDAPYSLTWRLEWEPSCGDGRDANGEEGGRREREGDGEREEGEERGRERRKGGGGEKERGEKERGEERERGRGGERSNINYYDFVIPTTIIRQTLSGFLATNNDLFNALMANSNPSCMASYIILS